MSPAVSVNPMDSIPVKPISLRKLNEIRSHHYVYECVTEDGRIVFITTGKSLNGARMAIYLFRVDQ